jgi:hypothetical protein
MAMTTQVTSLNVEETANSTIEAPISTQPNFRVF